MYYEKIKIVDLDAMTVNGITPNYTVDYYDFEEDETGEQVNYAYNVEIVKTVEQVVTEWREQQNATPQPTEQDKLQAQVTYTAMMSDTLLEV